MMKMYRMLAIPLAGALMTCGMLSAQEVRTQTPEPRTNTDAANQQDQTSQRNAQARANQSGDRAGWQKADQVLAACAAIGNHEEIAISQYGQDKVQNEQVKEFAQMMVRDHQAFLKKLEKFAPNATMHKLDTSPSDQADGRQARNSAGTIQQAAGTRQSGNNVRQTGGTRDDSARNADHQGQFPGDGSGVIQIQREIAQECLQGAMKALDKTEGEDIDKCFMGQQLAMHAAMKAKLTVFERHASDELSQVFAEGAQTTEQHLQKAAEIMEQLDSKPRDARRQERQERREERRQNN